MGYYVTLTGSDAILPADKLQEAYVRLCVLNTHDEWKTGGSYGKDEDGDEERQKWFSWMPADYHKTLKTVEEILKCVGYGIFEKPDGSLLIYSYDNKHGCEDVFIWSISDLFQESSYMEWRGEDGELWRWDFGGGMKMQKSNASIVWTASNEFVPINWAEQYAKWYTKTTK